jgi:hypothetical protein
MPDSKTDIIEVIRNTQDEVEKLVSSAAEPAWSTSGVAGFLVGMAKAPGSGGVGDDFDVDAWNVQAVAARQDKPIAEVLEEVRGNCQRDIESVQNAADGLLAQHFRAPWGVEGPLADVIVGSIEEHLMMHVRDLAKAVD